MTSPMTDERLREIEQVVEEELAGLHWQASRELLAEVKRLREYQADAAERFAAVVRQRDEAEKVMIEAGLVTWPRS